MVNKRLINTGVEAAPAVFDPLQNFETVTYTGNGGTQKITGYIRKGAAFNGSSSVIQNSSLGTAFRSQTTLTLSGWINTSASSETVNNVILSFSDTGDGSTELALYFRSTDGNKIAIINRNNGSNSIIATGETVITDGDWHHFAFVANSSGTKLYVDGSEETVTYSTGNASTQIIMPTDLNQFSIGANQDSGSIQWYMDGKIDQVRIFDKALSSSEVTTLYNETYASSTKSTTDIFGDGSGVALYELDEDANDTGGTYNGTPTNVNFLGMAFQPDLVWIKRRDGANNNSLYDTVRGAQQELISNLTSAEILDTDALTSFDSNGFSLGADGNNNLNTGNYVAWCWKAGGASVSNTDGSITSTVSANPDAGFSIVKYTGNNTQAATVGHGLNQTPDLIIVKALDNARDWEVFIDGVMTSDTDRLRLNSTSQIDTVSYARWDVSGMSSTVFGLTGNSLISDNTNAVEDYIAYCFHSVDGYQKVGSYSGGSANNPITLGFEPAFVMIKSYSGVADQWVMYDNKRSTSNPRNDLLFANSSNAESVDNVNQEINFDANGFTLVTTNSATNLSGASYIYLAIA